jgi:hypothetical protein
MIFCDCQINKAVRYNGTVSEMGIPAIDHLHKGFSKHQQTMEGLPHNLCTGVAKHPEYGLEILTESMDFVRIFAQRRECQS